MKDSQHALVEAVTTFVASNGRADVAIATLGLCVAVFGVGWAWRDWLSARATVGIRMAGLSMAVVVLALQVHFGGWLTDLDRAATTWLVAHRTPILDYVAFAVTNALGPIETAALAVTAAVIVTAYWRSVAAGAIVIATVGGASGLCWVIKQIVARPRPPTALQETLETDFSFPSGHVTGTVALFGIVVAAVAISGHRVASTLLAALTILAVSMVAASRLYLGVHWLTDVAAGACLGAATVVLGATLLRRLVDGPPPPADGADAEASATSVPA